MSNEELEKDELLTDKEAAEILKVSARTVQRLRLKKKLKSVKVTAKISRISRKHVQDYIKTQSRAA